MPNSALNSLNELALYFTLLSHPSKLFLPLLQKLQEKSKLAFRQVHTIGFKFIPAVVLTAWTQGVDHSCKLKHPYTHRDTLFAAKTSFEKCFCRVLLPFKI